MIHYTQCVDSMSLFYNVKNMCLWFDGQTAATAAAFKMLVRVVTHF